MFRESKTARAETPKEFLTARTDYGPQADSAGGDDHAADLSEYCPSCARGGPAPALNPTVNTQNRITNSGFTYDASGDMTADGTLTYTWDAEFRLKTTAGVTYTYDGDGNRVKKSSGPLYWHDVQGNLIEETNSTGGVPVQYIYFNGLRVTRREVLAVKWLFHDHLGSLRVMASNSGSILRTIDYYPYGGTFLNTGTSEDPFRFAQMYFDTESSLYQTLYRKYSPTLARWLSTDPVKCGDKNPQGLNLYPYVVDDPTNRTDPRGDCWGVRYMSWASPYTFITMGGYPWYGANVNNPYYCTMATAMLQVFQVVAGSFATCYLTIGGFRGVPPGCGYICGSPFGTVRLAYKKCSILAPKAFELCPAQTQWVGTVLVWPPDFCGYD